MKSFVAIWVAALAVITLAPGSVSDALALATQKITFAKLANKTFGAAPFTLKATASSGLPVAFSSTTGGICTVSGNTVTVVGAGKCTIRASQAGNAQYAAAPSVDRSFTVAKGNQTIGFAALGERVLGAPPFVVDATASSGLPVTFSSLTAGVCTVSASTVTLAAAGTCAIRASQPGNATYFPAPTVDRSFTVVSNANVTIRYTHDAVGNLIGVQRVSP